jgi:four helix bundle protein
MAFIFENLQVYQKAVNLADNVAALTRSFPRGYFFLADQLNRAALSIAANIAEGNGRFTKPDRKNFFTIARGSAQECVPLLEIARRRGFVGEGQPQIPQPHVPQIPQPGLAPPYQPPGPAQPPRP